MSTNTGFGDHLIDPFRDLITDLSREIGEGDDFKNVKSYCKYRISDEDYNKVSHPIELFDALEDSIGKATFLSFLKNLCSKYEIHTDQGRVSYVEKIEEYEHELLRKEALADGSNDPIMLTVGLTVFIGREDEMQDIKSCLNERRDNIIGISITGSAGIGKSALAIQSLYNLKPDRPHIVRCDLRGVQTMEGAFFSIMMKLVKPAPRYDVSMLIDALENVKSNTVLVLDNADNLVSTWQDQAHSVNAEHFYNMLLECTRLENSKVKLVLTSRQPLPVSGAGEPLASSCGKLMAVRGFAGRDDAWYHMELGRLSKGDSVRLLRQCIKPERFGTDDDGSDVLQRVATACDCRPKMLLHAATQIRCEMSAAQFVGTLLEEVSSVERVDEDLRRAAVKDYRAQRDNFQRMLMQLSVFDGWFSVETAHAVLYSHLAADHADRLGADDLQCDLDFLRSTRLLECDDFGRVLSVGGGGTGGSVAGSPQGRRGRQGRLMYRVDTVLLEVMLDMEKSQELLQLRTRALDNFMQYYSVFINEVVKTSRDEPLRAVAMVVQHEKNLHKYVHYIKSKSMKHPPFSHRPVTGEEFTIVSSFVTDYLPIVVPIEQERHHLFNAWAYSAEERGAWGLYVSARLWEADLHLQLRNVSRARKILTKVKSRGLVQIKASDSDLFNAHYYYVRGRLEGLLAATAGGGSGGEWKAATKHLERALDMYSKLVPGSKLLAGAHNELAHVLFTAATVGTASGIPDKAQIVKAKEHHIKAYELVNAQGKADFSVAQYLQNIGTCFYYLGKESKSGSESRDSHLRQALQFYRQALDTEVNQLNLSGVRVVDIRYNLALALRELGQLEEAAQMLERCLRRYRKYYGHHLADEQPHTNITETEMRLAEVYYKLYLQQAEGQGDKAEESAAASVKQCLSHYESCGATLRRAGTDYHSTLSDLDYREFRKDFLALLHRLGDRDADIHMWRQHFAEIDVKRQESRAAHQSDDSNTSSGDESSVGSETDGTQKSNSKEEKVSAKSAKKDKKCKMS